jgi:O-antigen/teichoic acid export membrane protein
MSQAPARPAFAANTLWTWASVSANAAMALVVSPLMIMELGAEAYGAWVLIFSVVEYYTLFDGGIRSALVKFVAHYWALRDYEEFNRTLNTAIVTMAAVGACLVVATLAAAPYGPSFFVISPHLQATFVTISIIAGVGWALSLALTAASAALEAVQRFDLAYRIVIVINVARAVLIITLLQLGLGLTAVVSVVIGARMVQCLWQWRVFLKHFPQYRWRLGDANGASFRRLFNYAVHAAPSTLGALLLDQGPGIVIGHAYSAEYVGYYSLPRRLIQAVLDLVHRLGLVTTARAAELAAHDRRDGLVTLGIQSNRYSLVVFLPAAIFLMTYGDALFHVWLPNPTFVAMSAPLLPVFVLCTVLSDAMQFNSSSMLYGMARHRAFSWLLLAEGLAATGLIYEFARGGDLFNAALASSLVMVVSRGFLTPYLLCRELGYPTAKYIVRIAGPPLGAGLAVAAAMWACRVTWLPGDNLGQVVLAGALGTAAFLLLAGRFGVLPGDRAGVLDIVSARAPYLKGATRLWFGSPTQ